jgi:two-component system response regulator AtoC
LKEITKAATQDLERQIILKVLEANGWNRRKTAKWLNISYRSLLYKLQETQGYAPEKRMPRPKKQASMTIPSKAAARPNATKAMRTGSPLN